MRGCSTELTLSRVGCEQECLTEEGALLMWGSGHLFLTQRCHTNWVGTTFTTHTPALTNKKEPGVFIHDHLGSQR